MNRQNRKRVQADGAPSSGAQCFELTISPSFSATVGDHALQRRRTGRTPRTPALRAGKFSQTGVSFSKRPLRCPRKQSSRVASSTHKIFAPTEKLGRRVAFMPHGSFGACPGAILSLQKKASTANGIRAGSIFVAVLRKIGSTLRVPMGARLWARRPRDSGFQPTNARRINAVLRFADKCAGASSD